MSSSLIANNAYQSAARMAQQIAQNEAKVAQNEAKVKTPDVDFGQMVQEAVSNIVQQGRDADQKAMGLVEGKTDVVDVVTAIAEAEVALEMMVSVCDRVISAYEEIKRMPI
ncbi:flagellar hook-basal body complex protein FliE [Roseibium sp. TrichSKD4]|uniref:flagellar hook-basal body complex protein FliE n=1 Tax=Roseibium sp. TrichSKD4 TaxID=744980 RepID=UPI0001E56A35|nr:flagellar hook-basal body complex protein FliE [Roseibium sp. TrichSKD4]EFO30751.1 flagellar hook-basal body complex protein FliE [Roseibium sp. TrichSKD4]